MQTIDITYLSAPLRNTMHMTILWLTHTFFLHVLTYRHFLKIFFYLQILFLWLADTFCIVFVDTFSNLWLPNTCEVWYCALLTLCEFNIKPELIWKYNFLNDNKMDYCDFFVTYVWGILGLLEMPISQKPKDVLHFTDV